MAKFFVKANATSPIIHIKETHKVSNNVGSSFFKGNPAKANCLHVRLNKNDTAFDDASVYMESGATPNFDTKFDAYDLTDALGFLTSDGLNTLSISGLPLSTDPQKVMVSAKLNSGNYSFTFEDLNSFATGTEVYLTDKYLNKNIKLNNKDSYAFNVNENNPFSFGINRFELLFTNSVTGVETVFTNENDIVIFPNPVSDLLHVKFNNPSLQSSGFSYALISQLGQELEMGSISIEKGNTFSLDMSEHANGIYFISFKNEKTSRTIRFVK